ncbi:MAG: M20/M25/M40 family metallo-hydrolase [Spirochaetaceae bacterium]|nr:MAG: M20/M25/M40 family metallo-hydrolase [Spirochaetaceae bacterium]
MKIAVLECEYIAESETPSAGEYTRLFAELLALHPDAASIQLTAFDVHQGRFPASVHDWDGYLISGSYAGVYDDLPWICRLATFLREAHENAIPLVGICFGHQILAHALGGAAQKADVGWGLGVLETPISRRYPWMGNDDSPAIRLIYMHQDQVTTLPDSATPFARTEICPYAAFTIDRTVLAIQGHPEFTAQLTEHLIREMPEKFPPLRAETAVASLAQEADRTRVAGWIARFFLSAHGGEMKRLARAIQFQTVSSIDDPAANEPEFSAFEQFLADSFPGVHTECRLEAIGAPGLLYTWEGTESTLKPMLFLAHYDVVPAAKVEPDAVWNHPPFSGAIAEGCVWGRGALDDKSVLMSILEAAERLIARGYRPRRTLLFAFGGDEEVTGARGAARIAAELARRGVRTAATFDEGAVVVEGMLPFLTRPIALIGVAEKGYLDLRLVAQQSGGHASMPGRGTALGRLSRAVAAVDRHPFPARLIPAVADFLRRVGRSGRGPAALLFRAPRLLAPVVLRALGASPSTDALVRTTIAPTMARGSDAPNVLPARAEAVINLRLLPGTSIADALTRVGRIAAPHGVSVEALPGASEPVPESPTNTSAYRALERVIAEHFPEAVPAPFLVTATTDSKHYTAISDAVYRFVPLRLDTEALGTIHGVNERITHRDYRRAVAWYQRLFHLLGESADE